MIKCKVVYKHMESEAEKVNNGRSPVHESKKKASGGFQASLLLVPVPSRDK